MEHNECCERKLMVKKRFYGQVLQIKYIIQMQIEKQISVCKESTKPLKCPMQLCFSSEEMPTNRRAFLSMAHANVRNS